MMLSVNIASMIWQLWMWSNWWIDNWWGKLKYSKKTNPSTTLSTTNPTRPDLGLSLGCRSGKPVTAWAMAWPKQQCKMKLCVESVLFYNKCLPQRTRFVISIQGWLKVEIQGISSVLTKLTVTLGQNTKPEMYD
jgi:hypothetical protein